MRKILFRARLMGVTLLVLSLMLLSVATALAEPPGNDDFDNATPITELPFSDSINTAEATTAGDDPLGCFELNEGATVWYAFTPAEAGRIVANTFGSDYNTTLTVSTGSRGSLNLITCGFEQMEFEAQAGETYFFMIGAYGGGPGGNLLFSVNGYPPTPPFTMSLYLNPEGVVISKTGVVTLRGTMTCSRAAYGNVTGRLEQKVGRALIRGSFEIGSLLDCDGETPWTVTFTGENGRFGAGKAQAIVTGYAEPVDGLSPSVDQTLNTAVTLKGNK